MRENWLWLLFEIAVNFYQGFLVTWFIDRVLSKKRSAAWASALCCTTFALCCSAYLFFDMPAVDTWLFLIPLLYALLCFRDPFGTKLLWWALLTAVFNGVTMLWGSLCSRALGSWSDCIQLGAPSRLIFVLSANVLLTVSLYILTRLRRTTRISVWSLIVFALINLLAEGVLDVLFSLRARSLLDDGTLLLASSMALGISLLSIGLFSIMSRYAAREYEVKRTADLLSMERQRAEELNAISASLHSLRHDLKNHLGIVQNLIESGHRAEGVQYLEALDAQILPVFSSGCVALDSALTLKELRMRREQIAFHCELCPLDGLPVSDYELCAIVTNLLDNAIEAILRHASPPEAPHIDLLIRRVRNMLYIECRNPADPRTLHGQDGAYRTSKSGSGHGLGIRSIQAIVSRAEGFASFTCEEQTFVALISLPCGNG